MTEAVVWSNILFPPLTFFLLEESGWNLLFYILKQKKRNQLLQVIDVMITLTSYRYSSILRGKSELRLWATTYKHQSARLLLELSNDCRLWVLQSPANCSLLTQSPLQVPGVPAGLRAMTSHNHPTHCLLWVLTHGAATRTCSRTHPGEYPTAGEQCDCWKRSAPPGDVETLPWVRDRKSLACRVGQKKKDLRSIISNNSASGGSFDR